MQEYDAVRVIRLNEDGRHYDGTEGVMRPPEIGDIGTIVHAADKNSFMVENVGPGGYTLWLADFASDELELVSRYVMSDRTETVISELSQTAIDAKDALGGLSAAQLNWKPAEKGWSIAQCLDHLITTHSLYFPLFERLATGEMTPTFWEKNSPLSGYFGKFLIKSLRPENQKKSKTTLKASPSSSEIGGDIVDRYCEHQAQLIDHLKKIPDSIDPIKTVVTSPLMGFVTYSLDDCYSILAVHGPRHIGQAKRVTEAEGFPRE